MGHEKMKIIIGYDGSENSDAIVEDLRRSGLPEHTEALVLTIADVFLPPPNNDFDTQLPILPEVRRAQERAQHKLHEAELMAQKASEKLEKNFPGWKVSHEGIADSPAWGLIRKADEWKPDLVVVGAQGHSVLGGRLILGSVSQRVLYETKCSVRISRANRKTSQGPIRLIAGLDGSAHSYATIDALVNRRWPKDTEVRLVSVIDPAMPIALDPADPSSIRFIEVEDKSASDTVRQTFEPAADRLRTAGLKAEVVIRYGKPRVELAEEATTHDVDSIFLGAKGMRGIERLLLGSVSAAVAATATCSVEIVRPNE